MNLNKCCNYSLFAYIVIGYCLTSIIYLLLTRNLGTPYLDAIRKIPEHDEIKKKSFPPRKRAFYIGVVASTLILAFFKPYGNVLKN